jgi:hypothetical protein
MTENENTTPTAIQLSDEDCSNIDTSFPLLAASTYELKIIEKTVKPSERQPEKTNLSLKLETTETGLSTEGEKVAPGMVIFHTISLNQTDKYNPTKAVALFMKTFGIPGSPNSFINNPTLGIGAKAKVPVKLQKATDQFKAANRIELQR